MSSTPFLRARLVCALLFVCVSAPLTGCLADLRDASLEALGERAAPQSDQQRGRALLDQMLEAHGGAAAYGQVKTATAVMRDRWYGVLLRAFVMPWKRREQRFEFQMVLREDASRLTYLDGPQRGEVVGIQRWATYREGAGEEVAFEGDAKTWFWLPTIQYFLEAAYRLGEASYVVAVGEREIEGRRCEGVFLTWGDAVPTMESDQYVAWIDAETHRLTLLEFTVRDQYRFATGAAHYPEYVSHQGLLFPSQVVVYEGDFDRRHLMHVMTVEQLTLDVPARERLLPDPTRAYPKREEGGP